MGLTNEGQFQRHSLAFQINRDKVKFIPFGLSCLLNLAQLE